MKVRCTVQAFEVRKPRAVAGVAFRPDDYYILPRGGEVDLAAEVHTFGEWGRETMSRRRWPQSDPRAYDYSRGRWLRCPTLDEQEGNAGEGFGDGGADEDQRSRP